MDMKTGIIYDSYDDAIKAGIKDKDLVQGTRETLIELQRRLNLTNKYQPHQGSREINRRLKQLVTK